jgi:hypothetical protein
MHDATPYAVRYARALKAFMKGKVATGVGLAENELSLNYHGTQVFRYYVDTGDITIANGGYLTRTTKARINAAFDACDLPLQVNQRAGAWYVYDRANDETHPMDETLHLKVAGKG